MRSSYIFNRISNVTFLNALQVALQAQYSSILSVVYNAGNGTLTVTFDGALPSTTTLSALQSIITAFTDTTTPSQDVLIQGRLTVNSNTTLTNNVYIMSTIDATNTSSAALSILGGQIVKKSLNVGGFINAYGGINMQSTKLINLPLPTLATDAANKSYVDSNLSTAGNGLTKTGTVFSVNAAQPGITSLGMLTGLSINGATNLTTMSSLDTSQSTSIATGAVTIAGGLGIAKNMNIGGNVSIGGTSTFMSTVTVPAPINGSDAASKNYVDSSIATAGAGLTKTGTVFSVNAAQPGITSLGTLTGLSVNGATSLTTLSSLDTTQSTSTTTGAVTIAGGLGVAKNMYVGGNVSIAGTSIFLSTVTVPAPMNATDASTKGYVDSLVVTAGTGLTKTGTVFSVNAAQSQVTSLGTLTSLTVSGNIVSTSTTQSTSTATGAMTIAGGLGIVKNLNVGQSASFAQTTSHVGLATFSGGLTSTAGTTTLGVTNTGALTCTSMSVSGTSSFTGAVIISNSLTAGATTLGVTSTGALTCTSMVNSGTSSFTGAVTVSNTLNTTGAVTFGSTLAVTGVTNLFTLSCNDTSQSTSTTTGGAIVAGGLGVAKNVNIGGTLNIAGVSSFTGTVTIPQTPVNATDAASKGYVDSNLATAGTGLTRSGTVFSVNALQPQITSIGTLSSLSVTGSTTLITLSCTDVTQSTSYTNGAVTIAGGLGIAKNLNIGGNVVVTGTSTFSSTVTVPTPVNSSDAVNKAYTDSLNYVTAGTGLTKTGGILSVNASQTQITSVGVLSALTVAGVATFNGTVSVPTPVNPTDAVNKAYADALAQGLSVKQSARVASTGAVSLSNVVPGFVMDGITLALGNRVLLKDQVNGIENGLYIVGSTGPPARSADMAIGANASGFFTFVSTGTINNGSGWVVSNDSSSATVGTNSIMWTQFSALGQVTAGSGLTKTGNQLDVQVDGSSIEIVNDTLRIASTAVGTGLSGGSGATISIVSAQPNITSLGTLTGLTVSGNTSLLNLTATGMVTVPTPVNATDAVNKTYTDGLSYLTAGTGLTKTGGTLSVNPSQTQITTVGTLTGLISSGTISITNTTVASSTTTGAIVISGGAGIAGSVYVGSNLSVTGTSTFAGAVTVPIPTASGHAVTKAYTDGLTYLTAGTGLTKTGATLTVNASQTQITAVGNLTGLVSSGAVSVTNTSVSNSPTSGALVVSGGVGITGATFIGGSLNVTGTVTVPAPVNATDATTKSYVDSLIVTAGTGLTKTGTVFSVNATQSQITTVGTLTSLSVSGTATLSGPNTLNGTTIHNGATSVASTFSVTGLSTLSMISCTDTTQSTNSTNGAVTVAGGFGVAKNVNIGGTLSITGASTFATTVTIPQTPMNVTDAASKGYVDSLIVTAGTGLTKTGLVFSVNTSQPQITNIGTLTSLTVSGTVTLNGTTNINGGTNVASTFSVTGATTLTTISCTDTSQSTNVTTGALIVAGGLGIAKNVNIGGTLSTIGSSSFSGAVSVSSIFSVTGATTLTTISCTDTSQSTSITTGALTVAGGLGIAKNVNIGGTLTITGASTLNGATSVISTFSVTGSSTFSTISSTDITQSTNTTTGAVVVAGGIGVAKNANIGGALSVTGISSFTGTVTIPQTPVNATDAASKGYVDSLIVTAGTGLTKTGTVFSINASQPQITSIGTLTGLSVSGTTILSGPNTFNGMTTLATISSTDTTQSTSTTTGAIIVAGGVGIAKNLYVGGNLNVASPSSLAGPVTMSSTLNVSGPVNFTNTLGVTLNISSAALSISGTSTLSTINASGILTISNTTQSTSTTTGALVVAGGFGLTKDMYTGANAYIAGPLLRLTNTNALLEFAANAYGASTGQGSPTVGTRSVGTCLSLWNDLSATGYTEYALGIDYLTMWYSVSNTGAAHKWFAGTTNIMTLTGSGNLIVTNGLTAQNLSLTSGTNSTSTSTGALVVSGGAGVSGDVNVGGKITSGPHTINSTAVIPPTVANSATFYVDPNTKTTRFIDNTGKQNILTDSMKSKGDILAYSQTAAAASVFGAGGAGTVLTADPASDFGFAWRGVDVNNVNVDPQVAKYCMIFSLADQILSTTGYNDLIFGTDGMVDRSGYIIPIVSTYVTIRMPGMYYVIANIDATNSTYASTTTVQWTIWQDAGMTGTFSVMTDSYTYSTHTSAASGNASITVYTMLNITNANGANVKVCAQNVSGTSAIKVINSTSNLNIVNIPNAKFISVLGSGTGTTLPTSYSNLFLSTAPYIDTDVFSYVAGQSSVTILQTGMYMVYTKMTLRKTTGTDTTAASIRFVTGSSSIYVPGTLMGSGLLTAGAGNTGKETISWWGLVPLNAGDTIRVQGQVDVGTSVVFHGAESGMFITFVPTTYNTMLYCTAYSATQSATNLSSTWTDISFPSIRSQTTGSVSASANNTVYTVQNQGVYMMVGTMVADNPGNYAGRSIYGQILTSVDNGSTWYPLLSGISWKQCSRRTGVIANGLMQLFPGTQIKFQIRTDGATTDNIDLGDGTAMTITCLEHVTATIISPVTFGTYNLFVSSSDNYTITNVAYAEKMRLTTKTLPLGLYRVSVFGALTILLSGSTVNVKCTLVQPDRKPIVLFVQQASFFKTGALNLSQINVIPLTGGVAHFILEVYASVPGGSSIQSMMIEMYRLS